MRTWIQRISCVLLIAVVVAGCGATEEIAWQEGDDYLLRFMPEPGQSYHVESVEEQQTGIAVMGQQIDQTQQTTQEFTYEAREVADDGTVTVAITPTRMRMSMEGPGGQQQFDTDDERVPPLFQPMTAMVGQTVTTRIAPTGEVSDVEGLEAVREIAQERIEDLPNPEQAEAMQGQLETMFGEDMVLESLKSGVRPHREAPVSVGTSWTVDHTTSMMMPVDVSTTYTLERVEDEIAYLSLEGTMEGEEDDADMMGGMGGASVDMSLSGTQTGTMEVDLPTGMVRSMNVEHETEGSGSMEVPEEAADQIDADQLDMTITTTGTTELTIRESE